jgi:phage terminase large subunit-like protein
MTAPFPKKVTQYLDEVSYAVNKDYVPSTFSLEMVNLIKLIDGGMTENITPTVHLKILDSFVDMNNQDIINLCHRGLAKSTLLEYLIFRIALYGELPNLGKIPHMIFVGDAMDGGVKKMRKALESRYTNSDFLQEYLKDIKFTDNRWEFIRKDGKSLVVSAYGGKTNIRGTRENGSRPVLALLDDIITDSDARSPTEIENINTNINNAVEFALHPTRRKVIWNGTPYNASDPLYTAVESGTYHVNVYPVCEKFPCREEDFRGSWEERFPYSALLKMYTKLQGRGKADAFYQEMMLQILSDDTRLISDSDLKWYSRKALMANKGNFNFYITTDFATSEKQFSDFSFISVWAVNNKGFKYWVDGICTRQTMDKNIDELFKFCQKYSPQSVGIEVSGQQAGFVSWIEKEMLTRNIFFSLASDSNEGRAGIRPSTSKLQRFNVAVPYFKMGEMFFPIEEKGGVALDEMLDELSLTTVGGFKSKHDDALDTISMLPLMPIWLPSSSTEFTQGKSKIWGTTVETGSDFTASYFC